MAVFNLNSFNSGTYINIQAKKFFVHKRNSPRNHSRHYDDALFHRITSDFLFGNVRIDFKHLITRPKTYYLRYQRIFNTRGKYGAPVTIRVFIQL